MKKTLLLLMLALSGILHAQTVNIPDANFKNFLLNYGLGSGTIDANNDGEIQTQEALAVNSLNISESPQNPFSSIVGIEAFEYLTMVDIQCSVSNIDLSGLTQLTYIHIQDSNLVTLNLEGLVNLQTLALNSVALTQLDISELQSLELLGIGLGLQLNSLTVGSNVNLKRVDIYAPQLTHLDLSGCPNLEYLKAWLIGADEDIFVNIKNGNTEYVDDSLIYINSSSRGFICIDEGEENTIEYNGDILLSTYCTFSPGGNYNVITGSLLFDGESDGCDSNDTVISNIKLNITDGTETGSAISSTGLYNFYTQVGTFTVTPEFDNEMFTITPPFAEINFTEVDSLVTAQNFCLTPNGNHPDLDIVIVPYGAQPGFEAGYKIIYRNKGNQMLSGDVVLAYQDDVLDLLWANPSEDSSLPGTLTWHYNNLAPFQQREIYLEMSVNGPMETPPVNIDDVLVFSASLTPSAGDDTPEDNTFVLNQVVVGSLDPNDITCLEGARVHPDRIGEYLHYNINFENTGTAPATFIVVEDMIDVAQFDISSLQLINASHPVQAKITGNKAEFRFDDINLGPQEKGSITFKIKTLNTLQANDDVTQQANIFFDYNWPIETNEVTTVFEVLSRGDFEQDNSVKVYPNPSNGVVNISAASEIKSVELYDMQGRLLQAGNYPILDILGRATGMYFLKVTTEKGASVEKLFKE